MICLNCKHMENMDYIHGCGVIARSPQGIDISGAGQYNTVHELGCHV